MVSYDEIEAESSLSRGTIQIIIHDHLKMKLHQLSEKNRKKSLKFHYFNARPYAIMSLST